MTRPVLVLRHAHPSVPRRQERLRPRLSAASLLFAALAVAAALVTAITPGSAGPVSLGRIKPVAMSQQQMNDRAERHPYYARKLGHQMARDFGWRADKQWTCLSRLWSRESSWRVHAANRYSHAYGIPQANPGRKMSSAGGSWQHSARTQIRWGLHYVHSRYSGPCVALHHEDRHGWY